MDFRDAVRKRKVIGPNRPGFEVSEWRKQAAILAKDSNDLMLEQAGEWFFAKFEDARSRHLLVHNHDVSRLAKLRAVVAGSNAAMLDMHSNFTRQIDELIEGRDDSIIFDEFRYIKLTSTGGASLPWEDCAESVVCGTQKALRAILQLKSTRASGKSTVQAALSDINLGIYYYALESSWERILWEGFEFVPGEPAMIQPSETAQLDAFVVTRERQDRLTGWLFGVAVQHFKHAVFYSSNTYVRPVVDFAKEGRRQRLIFGDVSAATAGSISAFVMRNSLRQQYYADIWFAESSTKPGLSLDLVMRAWEVVSTASQVMADRLIMRAPSLDDLNGNSPVLDIHGLCEAIKDEAKVEYSLARSLVDFLTFEGKAADDLWARPLVRVADNKVSPLLLAARLPELRRTIDIWLASLEIVVQDKGGVFNRTVQDVIAQTALNSTYLSCTKVILGQFKLPVRKDVTEEIDLLIVLGSMVVIGECKCTVMPSEPRDWYKHRQTVREAAAQAKRKAQAVSSNARIFIQRLRDRGITISEGFEVVPMVVLNTGLHAGMPVDNVPIVDLPILETFFEGQLTNSTVEREDGRFEIVPKLKIYSSAQDAWIKFIPYIQDPPQLRRLKASIKDSSMPLPLPGSPDVPVAILRSREVEIDMARLMLPTSEG